MLMNDDTIYNITLMSDDTYITYYYVNEWLNY